MLYSSVKAADLPDFAYTGYDLVGNLTNFIAGTDSYTCTYDDLNRLKTVTGAIGRAYTYDQLGNFDLVTVDGQTRDYTYAYGKPMRLMSVSNLSLAVDSTAGYDTWGNMRKYTLQDVAYELNFNTENRLASVKVGTAQPTVFAYDAVGQRVMTTQPDGTITYTPFPDYELTDPPTGADTVRTTYRLGGQIVAVQTKVGEAVTFYYTWADHLGNITTMSTTAGVYVADSRAWYDPFGAFISNPAVNPPDVTPVPSSNPSISNHGFTGHRMNNTGANDLGLIYMNARYYLPEIGRFISPDTIVPDPGNPQSYNRYAYVLSSPMNYTDPTGHRECGSRCPGDPYNWRSNTLQSWEGPYDLQDQQENSQGVAQVLSLAGDFMPGIGDVKGLVEVFTGEDSVTGEKLGHWRWTGILLLSEVRAIGRTSNTKQIDEALRISLDATRRITILGPTPIYETLAGLGGFNFFKIPVDIWNEMDDAARWAANQAFLDDAIANGDRIIVLLPRNGTLPGTFLERELEHLNKVDANYIVWHIPWGFFSR